MMLFVVKPIVTASLRAEMDIENFKNKAEMQVVQRRETCEEFSICLSRAEQKT
jgi:hypothetical protein